MSVHCCILTIISIYVIMCATDNVDDKQSLLNSALRRAPAHCHDKLREGWERQVRLCESAHESSMQTFLQGAEIERFHNLPLCMRLHGQVETQIPLVFESHPIAQVLSLNHKTSSSSTTTNIGKECNHIAISSRTGIRTMYTSASVAMPFSAI